MNLRRRTTQPTERDLAALADGSLPASRRPRVERAVAESAELQASVAAQRRVLSALHEATSEAAPPGLRTQVARARGSRRRPVRARAVVAAASGALTAALAAAALLVGGATGGATVAQASVIAARPAQAAAPVPPPGVETGALPGLRAAGLPFPYWEDAFGLRATGVRYDRVGGQPATTVFYARGNDRIAYTIVAGSALPAGEPARSTVLAGVRFWTLSANGRAVVTWLRAGHSCVLSGSSAKLSSLLRLASWRHGGEVPYTA